MKLRLERFINGTEETIGRLLIDGVKECYTLEDQYREQKVHGDTRIPDGTYRLRLRDFGTKHSEYASGKYGADIAKMHRGMLWLQDVPGFDAILIHIGNTDKDTEGCILVGNTWNGSCGRYALQQSTIAYTRLYPRVANAIAAGEETTIQIVNAY